MARRIIVDGIKVEGEDAQRIIDEAMRNTDETGTPRRSIPLSLLVANAIACGIVVGITGYLLRRYAKGLTTEWAIAIGIGVSLIVTYLFSRHYWRTQHRQLRAAMQRRGFDLCSNCGYWLKGLSQKQPLCPECGEPRE